MSSPSDLKVLNVNSSEVLREFFINCDKVTLHFTKSRDILAIGVQESHLVITVALTPHNSQVIDLGCPISLYHHQDDKIHVLTNNDEIHLLVQSDVNKWHSMKVFHYLGPGLSIVGFLPVKDCYILGISNGFTATLAFSVAQNSTHVIGSIDGVKETQKITFTSSPSQFLHGHIILLGTEEGHVYKFSNQESSLVFLCDIQQPVISMFCFPKHYIIVGEYGKIVLLNETSKKAAVCFGPTTILNCCLSNEVIYIQSPDLFLYSIQLRAKEPEFVGDVKYSRVKFVRSFHVTEDSAIIFTESGALYQASLNFEEENPRIKKSGSEVKPLLDEIHRKADELDELNRLSENVFNDLNQVSTALHLFGKDLSKTFQADVKSHSFACSSNEERLHIKLTNNSIWCFPSSHWSLQIFTNHRQQISSCLPSEWKKGETIELLLSLKLDGNVYKTRLQAFLIFRINNPRVEHPQVTCAFPINSTELGVLDLLEPASKVQASSTSFNDFIGFSKRKMPDNPWPLLLKRSWHRGFGKLFCDSLPPTEIHATYASGTVKFSLSHDKNQSTDVWILRIETDKLDFLRHIRFEISRIVNDDPIPKISNVIRIPSYVLNQLQSIRGRLNYVRSMKSCTGKDLEALTEEIRQVFAKEFYIR